MKPKITVRKIKHRLFGVGLLRNKKWTVLRLTQTGSYDLVPNINQKLLYPNKKKAMEVLKFFNSNNLEFSK